MGCGVSKKKNSEVISPVPKNQSFEKNIESIARKNDPNEDNSNIDSVAKTKISDIKSNEICTSPNVVQKPKTLQERIAQTPWIYENFAIDQIESLGEGTYGKVFGTVSKKTQRNIAIKYVFVQDDDEFNAMTKEINILSSLKQFGNVVSIEDKYVDSLTHEIFIAMERGDRNLKQYLEKFNYDIDFDTFLQIFADLSCGLFNAHKTGIIHSDIKPGNILVFENHNRQNLNNIQNFFVKNETLVFKLTDWGAGCANSTGKTTRLKTDMAFTTSYAAPELLIDDEHVNFEKADIYSLAMTMVNCCGVKFSDMRHISCIAKEEKHDNEIKEILENISKKYNEKTQELLTQMLKFDRHKRITLEKAIDLSKTIKSNNNSKPLTPPTQNKRLGPNFNKEIWKTQELNVAELGFADKSVTENKPKEGESQVRIYFFIYLFFWKLKF